MDQRQIAAYHEAGHVVMCCIHNVRTPWLQIYDDGTGYVEPSSALLMDVVVKLDVTLGGYRFLDKRFHHRPDWEFDLHTFACEKLGFSRNYDTGQLKARLQPAMKELEQGGFIKPISYRKDRPKNWSILVSHKVKKLTEPDTLLASPFMVVEKLVTRGVAKSTAEAIAKEFLLERVEEKVQYVDWLIARKDKRAPANTPGFLVAAIRNDYPLPKDYLKSRERKPMVAAAPAATKMTAPERRLSRSVEDFLAKLTIEERASLAETAVESADPTTADGYRRSQENGGPSFAAYQQMLIERYLEQRLKEPGDAAA